MRRTAKKTVKKMTGLQRLKRLVVVLERVKAAPKKRREFDMSSWAIKTESCGTHMCACGWGASDPTLQRQGLQLAFTRRGSAALIYENAWGFNAASEFFDISEADVARLFDPDSYSSVTDMVPVIKRIKAKIKVLERQAA